MRYSTAVRCPCGAKCPQLYRKDGSWNSRHGSAGLIIRCLPTSEGSRRYRRFGYRSITAARADGDHCGQLLGLAADDVTRRKIGDLIAAATGGTPLPAVEDVRRRLGLGLDPGQPGVTAGRMAGLLAGREAPDQAGQHRARL